MVPDERAIQRSQRKFTDGYLYIPKPAGAPSQKIQDSQDLPVRTLPARRHRHSAQQLHTSSGNLSA